MFICGSDEHGVPITIKAKKDGITPQQVVDKYHLLMRDAFKNFGISFDHYSRTTAPIHHETASSFFKKLYDDKVFTEEVTEQFYDEEAKQFLADRYITGTCPRCANPGAYGDQCEKCGSSLNPTDLIEPKSALSGTKPVLRKTRNWFLPLDKLQPEIEEYIQSKSEVFRSTVYGQCMSWLNAGLQPRAMTRDLDWGVKVPVDGADGKVLYVWFDAPIGYISATKEFFLLEEKAGKAKAEDWKKYWLKGKTKKENPNLIHFIGKDNIVFHCIIFPAMLQVHGGFVLPKNVPANEFLNLEGDKISTSRNWAVWLHEYLEDFPGRQDELRYVLTSIAPETKDADFSWKDFQARVNNELCSILGNFVNRVFVLIQQNFNGKISLQYINQYKREGPFFTSLDNFKFRDALSLLMDFVREGNKFLQENEPWKLIKTDKAKAETVLAECFGMCFEIAVRMQPFMPGAASKILRMMNLPAENISFQPLDISSLDQNQHKLNPSEILFKKIEDAEIEKQIKKLNSGKPETMNVEEKPGFPPSQKPEITFDDFGKTDIRVGTILEAEKVSGADKLLKLIIDTGIDRRTVVSGIAKYFSPEEIVGKQVSILVNLAPRKLKGIMSQGMILMAEDEDGKLIFVSPPGPVSNGSVVK